MVSALPLAILPVLAIFCWKVAGLPLATALRQHLVDEGDLRLVGIAAGLVHGDLHVAAENPDAVVEIQSPSAAVGLALIGGDRHVALRDAHFAKKRLLFLQVDFDGLRVEQ